MDFPGEDDTERSKGVLMLGPPMWTRKEEGPDTGISKDKDKSLGKETQFGSVNAFQSCWASKRLTHGPWQK